jgi:hypothetical protein
MITQCQFCNLNTAGEHEWNCPANACTTTMTTPKIAWANLPRDIPNTCKNCRWWEKPDEGYEGGNCRNEWVNENCVSEWMIPPAEFGCNQWEDNDGAK